MSHIVYNMNNTELMNSWESCELRSAVSDSPSSLSLQVSLQCCALCLSWFCPSDPLGGAAHDVLMWLCWYQH